MLEAARTVNGCSAPPLSRKVPPSAAAATLSYSAAFVPTALPITICSISKNTEHREDRAAY